VSFNSSTAKPTLPCQSPILGEGTQDPRGHYILATTCIMFPIQRKSAQNTDFRAYHDVLTAVTKSDIMETVVLPLTNKYVSILTNLCSTLHFDTNHSVTDSTLTVNRCFNPKLPDSVLKSVSRARL
jgi:hypothetical protein